MPIQVQCPDCRTTYRIQAEHAGKRFTCKQCRRLVEVPTASRPASASQPTPEEGDDVDWPEPTLQANQPLVNSQQLPREIKKKKKKRRRVVDDGEPQLTSWQEFWREGTIGGISAGILVSVTCSLILWLIAATQVILSQFVGNKFLSILHIGRVCWILMIGIDLWNGKIRGRLLSLVLSAFGLAWTYFEVLYFGPLMLGSNLIQDRPVLGTFVYVLAGIQFACWLVNIIALCTGNAARHCQDM